MRLFRLLIILLLPASSSAGLLMKAAETRTCSFLFENDLFGETDKHYTNGVKVSCLSKDVSAYAEINPYADWIDRTVSQIPYLKVGQGSLRKYLTAGASVGQKIFTPADIAQSALVDNDRPYAAWLYFSTAVHARDRFNLDMAELVVGLVGPSALGEEAQNGVHKLRDIDEAQGWNNQLHDELGVMMVIERRKKSRRLSLGRGIEYDFITHHGGSIGNVHTYLNAGAEMRIGWHIPHDFGTSLIRPGGDVNGPTAGDPRLKDGVSIYGFSAFSTRYVLRNIFLDGNTFKNSHSVEKRDWVGDLVLGVGVTWSAYKLTFSRVIRSKEFDGQQNRHDFGSINLSMSF